MNIDELKSVEKNAISDLAKHLSESDVSFLVKMLVEKDDILRYNAFLLLQAHSKETSLVYNHWNELVDKLKSDNSYQRSIGAMLLSENVKWDSECKLSESIDTYLDCCADQKFITARQSIQGITKILNATQAYDKKIEQRLANLPLGKYKENQQKILAKDIAQALNVLDKH